MPRRSTAPTIPASSSESGKPTQPEVAERLATAITRLNRQLRQHAVVGPTLTQLSVLGTISRGPVTLGELAAREHVRPPSMTPLVDRLEQQGLARRCADSQDRRVIRVEITPAGRRLLARSWALRTEYLEERLSSLSVGERATLGAAAEILTRLVDEDQESDTR